MYINHVDVQGMQHAIRGMRNPLNSHHLSDSIIDGQGRFVLGEKDKSLASRLIASGTEHAKFMRQIHVWVDICEPRYFWSEFDTYKFNNKNSESTMHKLLNNKQAIDDRKFLLCEEDMDVIQPIIDRLEALRQEFMALSSDTTIDATTKAEQKTRLKLRAKRMLPEGFLQMRTVDTTYAELRNLYHQRKNHELAQEWSLICEEFIKQLPYSFLITASAEELNQ